MELKEQYLVDLDDATKTVVKRDGKFIDNQLVTKYSTLAELFSKYFVTTNNFIELLFPFKSNYNLYYEFVEVAGDITEVHYYSDASKLVKLFTKTISYSHGNPNVIETIDEVNGKKLVVTISYIGDSIVNISKVIV